MSEDPRRRIEAFIQAAARFARTAPSGRILLARLAPLIDPAWLSEPAREQVRARLETARASATEPLELGTVAEVLRRAWDAPAADVLDELEPQPAAVTPTAQVHRAALDGAPVAVKVLRPGLSAVVRQDLVVLEGLLAPLAAALPRLDGPAILRELRERILDELDLENEAGLQRRVSRALRNHPVLTVPAPVMRLSHAQVLVSEWVEGTPLSRVSGQAQLDLAAGRVAAFVFGGVRAGIVHAGIDPDDVLLTADGRLAVLDFGAACSVEPRRADAALGMVEAFACGDGAALGEAVAALGFLDPEHGPATLELARAALGELGGEVPSRLDGAALQAAGERLRARGGAGVRLLLAANLPADQLWPLRAIAQAIATIARVGATAPWRELALRSLRGGWDAVE